MKDASITKTAPSIQQKEHKKFAFFIGDSIVKNINGYLLTRSIKIEFIMKVRSFLSAKLVEKQDYIKPIKQ